MASIHSHARSRLGGGSRMNASTNNNDTTTNNNAPSATQIAASSSAMNLFQKYSALNQGIDKTREEMKETRLKIDSIQQNITRTRQERNSMQRDIGTANKAANESHQQIDVANEALFEMEGEKGLVLMEQQQAQRELDQIKNFVDDQRKQFLDQSREFRASCKRVRLRSSQLGLEYAPLKAFATVMVGETGTTKKTSPRSVVVPPSDFDEAQNKNHQGRIHRPATSTQGQADPSSDPRNWTPDPNDEEMKQALQTYQHELKRQEEAKQSLENLKAKHKKATDQGKGRLQRKEQLLAQLKRIQKDNEGIQKDIADVLDQTMETKELGRAFEKDVKARRQEMAQRRFEAGMTGNQNPPHRQQQRPAGGTAIRTANPYARRSTTTSNNQQASQMARGEENSGRQGNNRGSSRNSNGRANNNRAPPPPRTSYLQQQHPHRTGRIRVDRQFASTVSITAPPAASHNNSGPNRYSILEDSDDSDDDILSCVPFSRRS